MTSVNLTPITKDEQPTSHITVGESHIDPPSNVVEVSHNGHTVAFEVETEEEGFASTIKNKAYLSPGVTPLFDGLDRTESFELRPVSMDDIPTCVSVTVRMHEDLDGTLINTLRRRQSVIHPIKERRSVDGTQFRFDVVEIDPPEQAVRVTDETEFTVLTLSGGEELGPVRSRSESSSASNSFEGSNENDTPRPTTVGDGELSQILLQLESATDQISIYREHRLDVEQIEEDPDNASHEEVMEDLREGVENISTALKKMSGLKAKEQIESEDPQSFLEDLRDSSERAEPVDNMETITQFEENEEDQ